MGKFNGVLLYSDYDDTLYNMAFSVSQENRDAIRYFMDNGGRFSIATGRVHRTFTPQIEKEQLEFNAPVILSNGSSIYDYEQDRYILESFVDEHTGARLAELCNLFPSLAFETYHGDDVYAFRPNAVTEIHRNRTKIPYNTCEIEDMLTPWAKVILEEDHPYLEEVQRYVLEHWSDYYEVIFSNPYLLELTCKGSTKGSMVKYAADLLGIDAKHIYCIGDNQNDIPMLAQSAIPFAPANCSQPVKDWGARIVNHCNEHAVASAIEILDSIY